MRDLTIIPENRSTLEITFRIDAVGVYLLGWSRGQLEGAVSIQWPWCGFINRHFKPGFECTRWTALTAS